VLPVQVPLRTHPRATRVPDNSGRLAIAGRPEWCAGRHSSPPRMVRRASLLAALSCAPGVMRARRYEPSRHRDASAAGCRGKSLSSERSVAYGRVQFEMLAASEAGLRLARFCDQHGVAFNPHRPAIPVYSMVASGAK